MENSIGLKRVIVSGESIASKYAGLDRGLYRKVIKVFAFLRLNKDLRLYN